MPERFFMRMYNLQQRLEVNKLTLIVLILVAFSTIPSIAQATRTEYFDHDPYMYVVISAPNEVTPHEEFPIHFSINTLTDLDIKAAVIWIWDGEYEKMSLFEDYFLKKGPNGTWSSVSKTITYKAWRGYDLQYPSTIECELALGYARHNSTTDKHVRLTFTLSWATSSTYMELKQVIHERENELNGYQSMNTRQVDIFTGITIVLIATTVYFTRRKPKPQK